MTPKSAAMDMVTLLQQSNSGFDLVANTDLFISIMPDEPDRCVSLFDTGGESPEHNFVYETCSFQVRVRGEEYGYESGYLLVKRIAQFFHAKTETWIGNTRYIVITANTEPLFVGKDTNRRPIFTVNFIARRTY